MGRRAHVDQHACGLFASSAALRVAMSEAVFAPYRRFDGFVPLYLFIVIHKLTDLASPILNAGAAAVPALLQPQ